MIRKVINDRSINRHQSSSLWRQCTNLGALQQIHASLIVNGFNSKRSSLREIIFAAAMTVHGTIDYAHKLFDQIREPDNFMWNTMIRGSSQSPRPQDAIMLYIQMEKRGVRPDNFTFTFLLKACTKLSWVNVGFGVHGKVVKYGFELSTFARNSLIYFHANCGDLSIARSLFDVSDQSNVVAWSALTAGYARRGELGIARELFDEMPEKDLVSWNVMITGYAKQGQMESARKLFNEVPKRDVVTWNAMIAGYVLCGSHKQALDMFEEMRSVGESPDEVTMISLLSACTDLGDLDIGEKLHSSLAEMGSGNLGVPVGNALIDMYAKSGNIERAIEVFRGMKQKDVTTWNSVILGLAFHGHANEAISLFDEMRRLKFRPNEITFVGVIMACSHAGKVVEGRQYYDLMRYKYNIEPNVRHSGCMVDMLGRVGLLTEAFEFIDKMNIEPNSVIWRTLLGACRLHGNVELGRRANERLLSMRLDHSGDYVLLANLYASRGEWDGAEQVRKLMDDSGVKKEPGRSSVEADNDDLMQFLFDSTYNPKTMVNSSIKRV